MEHQGKSIKDIIMNAEESEKNKDYTDAIELYKAALEQDNLYTVAYDRLMKLYRQSKNYKKELAIINKGIKAFGLIDKKGNKTYNPEPIGKWQKRKAIVEKKLK